MHTLSIFTFMHGPEEKALSFPSGAGALEFMPTHIPSVPHTLRLSLEWFVPEVEGWVLGGGRQEWVSQQYFPWNPG